MLTRTPSPQPQELDWFRFASALSYGFQSDYVAVRLLYYLEPLTTALTIVPKMLDVVEKSLKMYLSVHTQSATALTEARQDYGHDIEKLRAACARFDPVFDDADIRLFTKDLNDKNGKLYQCLRYGAQATTAGFEANTQLMPVVDKIFSKSFLLLPEGTRRVLVFSSMLKNLITGSRFDQSRNRPLLIEALRSANQS